MYKQITFLVFLIITCFSATAQVKNESQWKSIPDQTGWINDLEDLFTQKEKQSMDSLLTDYEKRTGVELVVITIPAYAIEKDSFDDLVYEIAADWKIGKADDNNGILIGISQGHRMIRIANGIGIEKTLSDFETKMIIDYVIIPRYKEDKFYLGTIEGIHAITNIID